MEQGSITRPLAYLKSISESVETPADVRDRSLALFDLSNLSREVNGGGIERDVLIRTYRRRLRHARAERVPNGAQRLLEELLADDGEFIMIFTDNEDGKAALFFVSGDEARMLGCVVER